MTLTSLSLFLGCSGAQAQHNETTASFNQSMQGMPTHPLSSSDEKSEAIDMKKLSEAFGHFIGRNLKSPGLSFDLENIIKGIREGAAGEPAPLSDKEYEEMMAAVQEKAFKDMSNTNLKSANDFMIKNNQAPQVVEIVPNKLQYIILKQGNGETVEPHSSPKIHYTGKYQDGTVFGTSEEMGGPITIPLDQTIPGFSKGIVGMKEGEKRRLFVHPDLGYGTTGQLPPNELLIFDIEAVKAHSEADQTKEEKDHRKNQNLDNDLDNDLDEEDEDNEEEHDDHNQFNSNANTMRSHPSSSRKM